MASVDVHLGDPKQHLLFQNGLGHQPQAVPQKQCSPQSLADAADGSSVFMRLRLRGSSCGMFCAEVGPLAGYMFSCQRRWRSPLFGRYKEALGCRVGPTL